MSAFQFRGQSADYCGMPASRLTLISLLLPLIACGGAESQEAESIAQGESCPDAVTGSGCEGALVCMASVEDGAVRARCQAGGALQSGEACSVSASDCATGNLCARLSSAEEAVCHKLCDPDSGAGCTGEDACSELSGAPGLGICKALPPRCDPLKIGDVCADDETCYLVTPRPRCVSAGTAGLLESCESTNCKRPYTCMNVVGLTGTGPTCYQACKAQSDCGETERCQKLDDYEDYGVCVNNA